jgi:hypothetical protein
VAADDTDGRLDLVRRGLLLEYATLGLELIKGIIFRLMKEPKLFRWGNGPARDLI